MLVRLPWVDGSKVCRELVELTDVTGTIPHFAGCDRPGYLDSRGLPGLDIPGREARAYIIGMVGGGWMIYDGRWKLCKYSTGEILMFDLEHDPTEQQNSIKVGQHWDQYLRLDALLTGEIMDSLNQSHQDRRVYTETLSQDPAFGKEGWQRVYPSKVF